jgi:DNA polymerase-3 subunit beta
MKLSIERAALLRSLAHVQSVVERRNAIPILSNVLIDAADGRLSLSTTDMDIAIVDTVDASVQQDGATTAPVHTLYDIVRKLPDGAEVSLSLNPDTNQIDLQAGRSSFSLSCLPREDFPAMTGDDLPHEFSLSAEDLRALIDRTRFAISTEETRYYLNGIYWHAADSDNVKLLRAVATDGHRLARIEMPLPEGAAGMPGIIVPRKAIHELRRLIDETKDPIAIGLSENKIRFAFDNVILTSKLIDGTFPDYERVIPSGNDKVLEVETKKFAEAVDRVSTISTEKSRAVKLNIHDGNLTLQATSPDAGSATEELEVSYDADAIEIGFNSKYLLDVAQQIEGDAAQFLLADAGSPTVIRDMADESALYVLMPMRV